jgi:membrane dipeptidase
VIVDAHNDLLAELVHRRAEERPFERYWRPELDTGGVGLQVCAIYAADEETDEAALRFGLELAAAYHRLLAETPDAQPVLRAADLDRLDSRLGMMLSLEGAEALARDPQLVRAYWGLGVRMMGLTWNHRNAFADGLGVEDDHGLTELGDELVDLLVELGVMLDLSHASPRTFDDVLARAPEPATVLVSHACCHALCDTPRNLTDDQLRAIAERGGVIGMMALPLTVGPDEPTISRFADHIDYAVGVAGIEHVGLGGDFIRQVARAKEVTEFRGGLFPPGMRPDDAIEGLEGPSGYPALVAELERRGYAGDRLEKILAGNWLQVFRSALPA